MDDDDFELRRSMRIPVSGEVRLTREEMAVIDHPSFQRLQSVRQLGLAYLISPGATHTRFEHSIGTVQTIERVLRALRNPNRSRLAHFGGAGPGQGVRFNEVPEATFNRIRRIARLAALVHDLGHGPLSHAFDAFAAKSEDVERWLLDEMAGKRLAALRGLGPYLLGQPGERIEHEAVSCILFAGLWHDLGFDAADAMMVASVLLKRPAPARTGSLGPWLPFIADLVSSAPIDVDRMDYLLRDSERLNVSYGAYDRDRIRKSALCVRAPDGSDAYRVGWKKSGLEAIEQFTTARFWMFKEMYYHKTLRAADLMLADIAAEAGKDGLSVVDASSLDAFAASYWQLSDEWFLRLLRGDARPGFPGNARISALAGNLMARHLWKRVYDVPRGADQLAERVLGRLREEFPERRFILDRLPLRAMKGLEKGAFLADFGADSLYRVVGGSQSWLDASPIMLTLRDEELSIMRIFAETAGKGDGINDERMRAVALGLESA